MADTIKQGARRKFTTVFWEVAQDKRLSLKARGLFLLMQSLPEDWEYSVGGLATMAGTGKDQIRSGLEELIEVGYLVKGQAHDANGKFAGNVYLLQDEAPPLSGNPSTDNPSTVFPLTENPTLQEKIYTREDNNIPPSSPPKRARKAAAPKEEFAPGVLEAIADFAGEDRELREALEGFVRNRQAPPKPKPVKTSVGMKSLLTTLRNQSGGRRDVMLLMITKAISNNWSGFYPLKPDEIPTEVPVIPQGDERRGRYL